MEGCAQISSSCTWAKSRAPLRIRNERLCCNEAFPVFDELETSNEAWNVYQFMLKLSSGAIGKIMLGQDFGHFASVDAPIHKMPLAMAETLSINKKIASRGEWYSHLPFGDPVRLKNLQKYMSEFIDQSIRDAKSSGTENLPLQDAALKVSIVIGKHLIKLGYVEIVANVLQTISYELPTPKENSFQRSIWSLRCLSHVAPVLQPPHLYCHGAVTAWSLIQEYKRDLCKNSWTKGSMIPTTSLPTRLTSFLCLPNSQGNAKTPQSIVSDWSHGATRSDPTRRIPTQKRNCRDLRNPPHPQQPQDLE